MKLPAPEDFDSNRKLFLDSFPGLKTLQLIPEAKDVKYPFNIPKVVHLPGSVYPDPEIFKQELYDRRDWIPFNYIKRLEDYNLGGVCISLTINETNKEGRKRENIKRIRALFADFDNPDTVLPDFDLTPSMVVNTSPGKFHAYWFCNLDEKYAVPLDSFATMQESIAKKYGTDESMKDMTKALRLPGFWHQKKDPYLVNIVSYTGDRYTYGELVEYFPPIQREPWSAPAWYKNIKFTPEQEFKGVYGTSEGGRNCHIIKRMGGAKKRGCSWEQIEIEAMKEAQACTPPLSEYETMAILKSMKRY